MSINRLPHVVACASQFNPIPDEPIAVHYWWGALGSFFPIYYDVDHEIIPVRWNLTECLWIVPGTIEP